MTEIFSTDLYVPPFQPASYGDWCLSVIPTGIGLGYWSSVKAYIYQNAAVLTNTGDSTDTWMSMTPLEVESSEWGVRSAHGHAVIMGFGMGWTAAAMANKPEVTRVTVVELDPEVPALFGRTVPVELRPDCWRKVEVVVADACHWRPDGPVDFMFADIWPTMAQPQNLVDLRAMQENVDAQSLYYWGQEIDLGDVCCSIGWDPDTEDALTDEMVLEARSQMDLPLVLPDPKGALVEGAWREWCRRMRQVFKPRPDGGAA